jgi:hypothetical protein
MAGTSELARQLLAVLVDQRDGRTHVLARGRTLLGIHDLDAAQTRELVGLASMVRPSSIR